jgi:hypothetical protein
VVRLLGYSSVLVTDKTPMFTGVYFDKALQIKRSNTQVRQTCMRAVSVPVVAVNVLDPQLASAAVVALGVR